MYVIYGSIFRELLGGDIIEGEKKKSEFLTTLEYYCHQNIKVNVIFTFSSSVLIVMILCNCVLCMFYIGLHVGTMFLYHIQERIYL